MTIDIDIKEVNGINIYKYQRHPRILELRIIMLYNNLINNYDVNTASDFMKSICNITKCNWTLISGILNNNYNIRRLEKTDKKRFQQEVVIMGMLYNETRYYVAQNYLGVAVSSIYHKPQGLKPELFINQHWLDDLDDHIVLCGAPNYRLEAEKFIEGVYCFLEVMGHVFVPKTRL